MLELYHLTYSTDKKISHSTNLIFLCHFVACLLKAAEDLQGHESAIKAVLDFRLHRPEKSYGMGLRGWKGKQLGGVGFGMEWNGVTWWLSGGVALYDLVRIGGVCARVLCIQ